jgi:glycosyltransferase involved in cell wall biosynthesis
MCRNLATGENCRKCLTGSFLSCAKGRCIHGSAAKSVIGTVEAIFWKWAKVYRKIDRIICCSEFLKKNLDTNPVLAEKTIVMHNFVDAVIPKTIQKKDYVLYFGRFSEEKGMDIIVQAAGNLPEIPFVFAGSGPLEHLLEGVANIRNVGFQKGEALEILIREARFAVIPSVCYENCPFSVMESQMYGTPVLGADIGGIPELIRDGETGELFESGNIHLLKEKIQNLWEDRERLNRYSGNCETVSFDSVRQYTQKLIDTIYTSEG